MSKQELNIYHPPLLLIKSVIPTLEKDGRIYAHRVIAETELGKSFEFIERRGIPMEQYIGKTAECLLEILNADFLLPKTKEELKNLPKNTLKGQYLWEDTGYKFIPELVEMIEGYHDDEDYDYDEDEYDRIAGDYFESWGDFGIGLDVYQYKPMIKTDDVVFLFNEVRNEEVIDEWELGDTIYFKPTELLLRGINIVEKEDWRKNKPKEIEVKDYESVIVGRPKEIDGRR